MKIAGKEELVKVFLSEVTQTQKDKHGLFPYMWILVIMSLINQS